MIVVRIYHDPELDWCAQIKAGSEYVVAQARDYGNLTGFTKKSDLRLIIYRHFPGCKLIELPKPSLHRQLVDVAHKWALNNCSCGVAFKEIKSYSPETPDVIAFGGGGHSVLIEVKTSRSDFKGDKRKFFRQHPEQGMGTQRFYCCPQGLIKKEELPEGWGLIYVNDRMKARCVYSPYIGNIAERHKGFQKNHQAERDIMYSMLRRLQSAGFVNELYKMYNGEKENYR